MRYLHKLTALLFLMSFSSLFAETISPLILVNIQQTSHKEINTYNPSDLEIGILTFNTNESRLFEYPRVKYLEPLAVGNIYTGSLIRSPEGIIKRTSVPFKHSQIPFAANSNVDRLSIDSYNGKSKNTGSMNKVFRITNPSSVSKIKSSFHSFTIDDTELILECTDNVIILNNINSLTAIQTDHVNREVLLGIFTAYK